MAYILEHMVGVGREVLFVRALAQGLGGMGQLQEREVSASNDGSIVHTPLECHSLLTILLRLEQAGQFCPKHAATRSVAHRRTIGQEEILGTHGRGQQQIVIKLYEVFAQSWYAPGHSLYGDRVEGRQILLIAAEDDLVVNYLYRDMSVRKMFVQEGIDMRVLLIGDDVYLM